MATRGSTPPPRPAFIPELLLSAFLASSCGATRSAAGDLAPDGAFLLAGYVDQDGSMGPGWRREDERALELAGPLAAGGLWWALGGGEGGGGRESAEDSRAEELRALRFHVDELERTARERAEQAVEREDQIADLEERVDGLDPVDLILGAGGSGTAIAALVAILIKGGFVRVGGRARSGEDAGAGERG